MATDLDEMLGTDDEEETRPKPKPEDEESLAPAVGAPTAQPLIPPPSMSAIPAPEMPMSGNDPATNPLAALGSPAQPAPPAAAVASPMDKYNALHAAGAPVSHKTGFGGGLLKGLDVAGNIIVPGVMANIPGTTMHQKFAEQSALNAGKQGEAEQAAQANLAHTQAETGKLGAETDALKNPQPKPKEEKWGVQAGLLGPNGRPVMIEQNSGQFKELGEGFSGGNAADKTAEQGYAAAIQAAQKRGVDPAQDPTVQQWAKAIQATQKPQGENEEERNIQSYLKEKGLPDNATNRSAAIQSFRPPEKEPGNYQPVNDARGNTIGWVDPKSKHFVGVGDVQGIPGGAGANGATPMIPRKPTGMEESRLSQAEVVKRAGDGLIQSIESKRAKVGNVEAIIKSAFLGTPVADKDLAGLATEIASFAALNPAMHGFRGQDALREFEKIIGGIPKDPDALIESVKAIQKTAGYFEAPTAAAQATAGGGKTYTDAEVQAAAKAHGMNPTDVEKAYQQKGYKKGT